MLPDGFDMALQSIADSQSQGVARLKKAGLLKETTASDGSIRLILASESLLRDWPALQDYKNRRKALREMASAWYRDGRSSGALLDDGDKLKQANTLRRN